jgi:magnesium chelatase subunit D
VAHHEDDPRWLDAALVASLLAVDPVGLGGACIRAGNGSARAQWLHILRGCLPAHEALRRIPAHVATDRLLGGLDLTATLGAGRAVAQRGLLAEANGSLVVLPMVERFPAATLAHICAVIDTGEIVLERTGLALRTPTRFGVIAFDEGVDDEERPRAELLDRLGFLLDFSGLRIPASETTDGLRDRDDAIAQARACLPAVRIDDPLCQALCVTAMKLGIASIRASLIAVRAACVMAALQGRTVVDETDAAIAARLVLAPRATVLPQPQPEEDSEPEQEQCEPPPEPPESPPSEPPPPEPPNADAPDDPPPDDEQTERSDTLPEELILAAALAAIPKGLLERLRLRASLASRARSDGRAGAVQQSLLRGRPAGARRGEPRAGVRLNLIETLRAAAPWQAIRRATTGARKPRPVEIRRDDFHITRYKHRTQTTTIFVVDASGSSALNRLAEAKGAVELLLADCYVRRDQVAVIAFRGTEAELVLPPTRSLLRAKRSLAGMPGGAGTPLAAAIDTAVALVEQVRRAGQTATLVLLTDGQANVARDGTGGRERGQADALLAAQRIRAAAINTLFIDISPRAQPQAGRLATAMDAHYLLLPYADAATLSGVVKTATATAASRRKA